MQEMNKAQILSWLLNQTPAIIVLAGLSVLLWSQNERAQEENKACNQAIISIYQAQNERMLKTLEGIEFYLKSTNTTANGKEKK